MNKNLKLFTQIIFYGSIWGILEATIGHVLHFIPATIAGSIMFPIAALILYKAYEQTKSKTSLMYIGIVASAIKSVNFLMPQLSVFKTINPMISILFESLVVIVVIHFVTKENKVQNILSLVFASISWRGIFVGWMGLQYILTGNLAPYLKTFALGFEFIIIVGIISGLFAAILVMLSKVVIKKPVFNINQKPIFASFLLLTALFLTYTL